MDIKSIIDRLNNELEKLNNIKNKSINTNTFFTNDENFNDNFSFDDVKISESVDNIVLENDLHIDADGDSSNISYDIEPDDKTLSLVEAKERHLFLVQAIFKKSIRVSLKSFLISISLSFLNLFI